MKTLLISDVHCGLETSRVDQVLDLLNSEPFDLLVVVGDLCNMDLNLSALDATSMQLLESLEGLARRQRLVLIRGNHDPHICTLLAQMWGIEARDSYTWGAGGKTFYAEHGNRYDRVCSHSSVLATILTWLLTFALAHRWLHFSAERFADWFHVEWEHLKPKVQAGTMAAARSVGAQVCFAGHTHFACEATADGVHYINLGCWLGTDMNYAVVDSEGATLKTWRAQ